MSYIAASLIVAGGGILGSVGGALAGKPSTPSTSRNPTREQLLGAFGLLGNNSVDLLKSRFKELVREADEAFIGSPEFKKRRKLVGRLRPEEQQLIDQAVFLGLNPLPLETSGQNILDQILSGSFLPGSPNENQFVGQLIDDVRESRDNATDSFLSNASNILGGVGGAGSVLPELQLLGEEFQDAENRINFALFERGMGDIISGLGLLPSIAQQPFARLQGAQQFASIPRLIDDQAIVRAFDVFNARKANESNVIGGAVSQLVSRQPAIPAVSGGFSNPIGAALAQSIPQALDTVGSALAFKQSRDVSSDLQAQALGYPSFNAMMNITPQRTINFTPSFQGAGVVPAGAQQSFLDSRTLDALGVGSPFEGVNLESFGSFLGGT